MGGHAVRAKTDATIQTAHVLLVLLCLFVNYAGVVELLREEDLKPTRNLRRSSSGGTRRRRNRLET